MDKPMITSLGQISPVILQKYERYLPTAFDESLTLLEKINKVILYLNQIGEATNNVVDQWNTVMEWVLSNGMTEEINLKLNSMLTDGTLDTIINQNIFNTLNTQISTLDSLQQEDIKKSINGENVFSISGYKRIAPENNDIGRLNRLIQDATVNSIVNLSDENVLEIPSTLFITKKVHIVGNQTELRTITDGMDNAIEINGVDGFSIIGLRFNQNLKGRTSVHLNGCSNFLIERCYFTGYSKEFAYYQTDGGIRMENCVDGKILFNVWENHGFQYGTNTSDLNRCLQMGGTQSNNMIVIGNTFKNVNQAIVTDSGFHTIMGNTFKNVRDNVLYMVGETKEIIFTGNYIDAQYDEGIVISGENATLLASGNTFKNCKNKFIAVAGNIKDIYLTDNTFDTTEISELAQFIGWRDNAHNVRRLVIENNKFKCPVNALSYPYFSIGNIEYISFKGNEVDVFTHAGHRMIYFQGTQANGIIENNNFKGTEYTSLTVEVSSSVIDANVLYKNNNHVSCRGRFIRITVEGHNIQFTAGPYILEKKKLQRIFSDAMPNSGTWSIGDYVTINTPVIAGSVGSRYVIKGWLRLTNGTSNTLNTDWIEDRCLTGQ